MLSKSEIGLKGLRALFEFYHNSRQVDAEILAEKSGYKVVAIDISPFVGYLTLSRHIEVSLFAFGPLRKLVIYHELAHHCLACVDGSLLVIPAEKEEHRREIEYWCDSFAVAMLFGNRGVFLLPSSAPTSFFTEGVDIKGDNRKFEAKLDQFQGKRIVENARRFFARGGASRSELVGLGEVLIAEGHRKLKEPPK